MRSVIIEELGRLRLFSPATRAPFPRRASVRPLTQQHTPPRARLLFSDKERDSESASRSQSRNIAGPKAITAIPSSEGTRTARDSPLSPDPVLGKHYRHQSQSRYATRLRSSIAGKPFVVGLGALRRPSGSRVPMSGEHSSQMDGGFNSRPAPPLRSYTPGPPDSSNFLQEQIAKQQRNNFHSTSLSTSIKMVAQSVNKTALHPKGVEYVPPGSQWARLPYSWSAN